MNSVSLTSNSSSKLISGLDYSIGQGSITYNIGGETPESFKYGPVREYDQYNFSTSYYLDTLPSGTLSHKLEFTLVFINGYDGNPFTSNQISYSNLILDKTNTTSKTGSFSNTVDDVWCYVSIKFTGGVLKHAEGYFTAGISKE